MGAILGFLMMVGLAGGAASPMAGGRIYDITGGYDGAFLIGGAPLAAAALIIFTLKPP